MNNEEPVKCPECKEETEVGIGVNPKYYYVSCFNLDNFCWTGPEKKTKQEAIKAWNEVMGGKDD